MTGFFGTDAPAFKSRPIVRRQPVVAAPDPEHTMRRLYALAALHPEQMWSSYMVEAADVIKGLICKS